MKEKDLLEKFLSKFPESTHPLDRERFVEYAIECIKNEHYIDIEAFENHGISEKDIDAYKTAFGWIKEAYNKL